MSTMKRIVIAAEDDKGLNGEVSQHFGRCPFFFHTDVENDIPDGKQEFIEENITQNPFFGNHQPGVVPNYIKKIGANVIIAGGMGPRAISMFQSMNIEVVTGTIGNVGKVLEAYLHGDLKGIIPCQHDHPQSCGGHGHTS